MFERDERKSLGEASILSQVADTRAELDDNRTERKKNQRDNPLVCSGIVDSRGRKENGQAFT